MLNFFKKKKSNLELVLLFNKHKNLENNKLTLNHGYVTLIELCIVKNASILTDELKEKIENDYVLILDFEHDVSFISRFESKPIFKRFKKINNLQYCLFLKEEHSSLEIYLYIIKIFREVFDSEKIIIDNINWTVYKIT